MEGYLSGKNHTSEKFKSGILIYRLEKKKKKYIYFGPPIGPESYHANDCLVFLQTMKNVWNAGVSFFCVDLNTMTIYTLFIASYVAHVWSSFCDQRHTHLCCGS